MTIDKIDYILTLWAVLSMGFVFGGMFFEHFHNKHFICKER